MPIPDKDKRKNKIIRDFIAKHNMENCIIVFYNDKSREYYTKICNFQCSCYCGRYNDTKRELEFPNGTKWIFITSDNPNKLIGTRGPYLYEALNGFLYTKERLY